MNNNHPFLFVKRSGPNYFGFLKIFRKKIALDRSDVDYEAELSEAVLVAFSLVDDFGLSDVFD